MYFGQNIGTMNYLINQKFGRKIPETFVKISMKKTNPAGLIKVLLKVYLGDLGSSKILCTTRFPEMRPEI